MPGSAPRSAEQMKHLELIQGVVSRLGGNGFLIKGWSVTISGALMGVGVSSDDWAIAALAIVPLVFLWGLDAYFLRAERLFRALYDRVRAPGSSIEPFFLSATSEEFSRSNPSIPGIPGCMASRTLASFYLALIASTLVVAALLFVANQPGPGCQTFNDGHPHKQLECAMRHRP
jgi:hypothetical protein